jgi:hypothetical protein
MAELENQYIDLKYESEGLRFEDHRLFDERKYQFSQ